MILKIFLLMFCQYWINGEEIQWNKFHQNDYDIIPYRIELEWYNKSYFIMERFELAKYNRTTPRSVYMSMYVIRDFQDTLMIFGKMYKSASNRYLAFPENITVDGCREFNRNTFNILKYLKKYSNIKECPFKKGHYVANGVTIDSELLPPFLPRGDYKVTANMTSGSNRIMISSFYASVVNKPGRFF